MPALEIEAIGPRPTAHRPLWRVQLGPSGPTLSGHEARLTLSARGRTVTMSGGSLTRTIEASLLELLPSLLERLHLDRPSGTPFGTGLIGYLGYASLAPEPAPHPAPDAWFVLPRRCLVEALPGAGGLQVTRHDEQSPEELVESIAQPYPAAATPLPAPLAPAPGMPIEGGTGLRSDLGQEGFEDAVRRCLGYIAAGDAYQVNLSHRLTAPTAASGWALFEAMQERHPAPYAAYLDLGAMQIVGNSPEQFLRREAEHLCIRPIKGTRPRGRTPTQDEALGRELEASEKDRAEHVMIVDLVRNDLGRVARTGTVKVPDLARLEAFPTVHHLVSTVAACLQPSTGLSEILRATFPCGSVTGAPKIRSMEIIRELEPTPRGPYTGAMGVLETSGDLHLAVSIRTAVVHGGSVEYRCGGGIVADSDPTLEWEETMTKAEVFLAALRAEPSSAVTGAPDFELQGAPRARRLR